MQTGSDQYSIDGPLHKHSRHNGNRYHRKSVSFAWLHLPWFGYLASLFLIGFVLFIEWLDRYFPYAPIFIGAPFGLISVLVGLIWGLGPALFSIVVGVIVIARFISPGLITANIGMDVAIIGPFVIMQLVAVGVVIWLEMARRRIQQYARGLERANQRLVEVNEQLERANYLKDYVITRSSHELRTPMTTILGRTQLVLSRLNRSEKTSEPCENQLALRKHLEIIETQAFHLRALINELFDLSNIRSQELPLRLVPCDLGSLCCDVVEDQRTFSDRVIELELPVYPIILYIDEKRFSQVLTNLVDNAVKYSSENTMIHVRVCPEYAHVILQVNNEGPALSQDQLEHLFEPFYRTLSVEHSSVQGWGLGLSISKEIVERHGGQIWAESTEGKGTTFFVKLSLPARV